MARLRDLRSEQKEQLTAKTDGEASMNADCFKSHQQDVGATRIRKQKQKSSRISTAPSVARVAREPRLEKRIQRRLDSTQRRIFELREEGSDWHGPAVIRCL